MSPRQDGSPPGPKESRVVAGTTAAANQVGQPVGQRATTNAGTQAISRIEISEAAMGRLYDNLEAWCRGIHGKEPGTIIPVDRWRDDVPVNVSLPQPLWGADQIEEALNERGADDPESFHIYVADPGEALHDMIPETGPARVYAPGFGFVYAMRSGGKPSGHAARFDPLNYHTSTSLLVDGVDLSHFHGGRLLRPHTAETTTATQATTDAGQKSPAALLAQALAVEIDPTNPPPPAEPRFTVAGRVVCTAGNLTALTARAKTGKTAVLQAFTAAAIVADKRGNLAADTLGIESAPPEGKAVIMIDTEQAPDDACAGTNRALSRAGLRPDEKPEWLRVFTMAGQSFADLQGVLPALLEHLSATHDGIHVVMIDGVADLVANVNEPKDASALCTMLHGLAIRHACPIIGVIHSNEGRESDDIARGWLGKQLRRKSESNLQLKRDGETITLFGEDGQRRAPIPQHEGPRFAWSEEKKMHVSVATAGENRRQAKRDTLMIEVRSLFEEAKAAELTHAEFCMHYMRIHDVKRGAAEAFFTKCRKAEVVKEGAAYKWHLV